ncbi:DinB family protein [Kribbella hippodromi]|uniref:DinB family protein n=1 Tax=Kribbella hippodromi TaxID=434347 RepID=A0ABN2D5X0_9ACTN
MAKFGRSDDLKGAEFFEVNLHGARFLECDLSGVVMRGVDIQAGDIDSPWLGEVGGSLKVNGIEVAPYVDAELNRRFPGRADRFAPEPDGLRAAWAAVERTWTALADRVAAMPEGTVDASVGGEWSFAQTQRHLVHATDVWLGRAILQVEQPFHRFGLPHDSSSLDQSVFAAEPPTYAEVLEARADRVGMVRDYLAAVTSELLDEPRKNPWSPDNTMTVRACLHVILGEEWEHYRFISRDLDTLPT